MKIRKGFLLFMIVATGGMSYLSLSVPFPPVWAFITGYGVGFLWGWLLAGWSLLIYLRGGGR